MSRATVAATINAALTSLGVPPNPGLDPGVTVYEGEPETMPSGGGEYPLAIFQVGQPVYEQLTFGAAGTVAAVYDVTIHIVLGTLDMTTKDAEAAQLAIADKMRYTFLSVYASNLLAAGFDTVLAVGNDNIETFQALNQQPQCTYVLRVTEQRARNAAVA